MNWQIRTRYFVAQKGSWRPCLCIQGGGAKGAWQAGVLSSLLASSAMSQPVATWGTSAGALNGLWAATRGPDDGSDSLLEQWLYVARHVRRWVLTACMGLIGVPTFLICAGEWRIILLAVVVVLIVPALLIAGLLVGCVPRLPGLFPISWALRVLPPAGEAAKWYCYSCAANIRQKKLPEEWNFYTLGTFTTRPGEHHATFPSNSENGEIEVDSRLAAMISAALPVVFRPYAIGNKLLLDGGLESNLPAGFFISNGTLGGGCLVCIIPKPVSALDPREHVDYRVLKFLHTLKMGQEDARTRLAKAGTSTATPAHTLAPALIIAPQQHLASGLVKGFFLPDLLKKDYRLGKSDGRLILPRLHEFEEGNDDALGPFLLENTVLPALQTCPTPAFWALWANPRWRRRSPNEPDQADID